MDDNVLKKIKKGPVIIEGFPGLGLIGSIATEFLISHLSCEKLGDHYFEDLPANIAIHQGKLIEPVGIYYNKRFNIVIIHSLIAGSGIEWKAADFVIDVANKVKAKEIISIEGVGSTSKNQGRTFFFTSNMKKTEELKVLGLKQLSEGIILGVTSALMVKSSIPVTCIFGEARQDMPDNEAASRIIGTLDKVLGLDVDPKPLKEAAKMFEDKYKSIMEQMQNATDEKDKRQLSYLG